MKIGTTARGLCIAGLVFLSGCREDSPRPASAPVPGRPAARSGAVKDVPPIADTAALPSVNETPAVEGEQPAEITVVMEDCKGTRPGKITANTGVLKLLFTGPPTDKLTKRGTVPVDGQEFTLYLPKAESYSIENSGSGDSDFENDSTLISIDYNGDGKLTAEEGWYANLPLRLGEKMFDVAEIAADGSRIVLKPSPSPLRGVIVGRVCPPFSFETAGGVEVSAETLAGKPFVLDIWSFT